MPDAMTRPRAIAFLCASSVSVLAACGSSEQSTIKAGKVFPLTVSRDGRTVTFTKAPQRVLVKDAEAASMIGPAGGNMTGKIVALASANSDGEQPREPGLATLAGVPRIEPDSDIAKEVIVAHKPDLVIAHGYTNAPQDQLKALGIDSLTANVCTDSWAKAHGNRGSFDEIYEDVTMLGKLLGTERYAAKSVATMKQTVAAITAQAPALRKRLPKPTAAITYFYQGGFYTYGAPSMGDAQIRALGLTNVFGHLKARGTQLNGEEFIAKDPALVVIATGFKKGETKEQVLARVLKVPGVKNMTAIREHRVVILPGGFVLGRSVEGVQAIADAIGTFT